ncbi:MAG TPA: hypothetical protein VN646_16495 [Candidatus Acidoferrum sp.]|nr:hypothetical protein [Candidatus Acidoferrum sp.]
MRVAQASARLLDVGLQLAHFSLGAIGGFGQLGGVPTLRLGLARSLIAFGLPGGPPLLARSPAGAFPFSAAHETQAWATRGAGKYFEAGRGQLLGEPSRSKLIRPATIHGGPEERVRDPPLHRRGGAMALPGQDLTGAAHERIQLGALALQRLTGGVAVAELRATKFVDARDEGREALGLGARQLVHRPERDGRLAELANGLRVGATPRRLQRGGSGVPPSGEILGRQGVELLNGSIEAAGHGNQRNVTPGGPPAGIGKSVDGSVSPGDDVAS